jgi:hypothetical protein
MLQKQQHPAFSKQNEVSLKVAHQYTMQHLEKSMNLDVFVSFELYVKLSHVEGMKKVELMALLVYMLNHF